MSPPLCYIFYLYEYMKHFYIFLFLLNNERKYVSCENGKQNICTYRNRYTCAYAMCNIERYVTLQQTEAKKCTSFLKPFSGKLINAYIRQMHVCMPWRPLCPTSIFLFFILIFSGTTFLRIIF